MVASKQKSSNESVLLKSQLHKVAWNFFWTVSKYFNSIINYQTYYFYRKFCWWLVEVAYRSVYRVLPKILGIFPCEVKNIILCKVGIHKISLNLQRSEWTKHQKKTQKNSKFQFGWRWSLVVIWINLDLTFPCLDLDLIFLSPDVELVFPSFLMFGSIWPCVDSKSPGVANLAEKGKKAK